jgi:hypothetical protein
MGDEKIIYLFIPFIIFCRAKGTQFNEKNQIGGTK